MRIWWFDCWIICVYYFLCKLGCRGWKLKRWRNIIIIMDFVLRCVVQKWGLLWKINYMLLMVRSGTINVTVIVALLCISCIIMCKCVEIGESLVQKWGPVIVWGSEVGTRFEWGTIIEWTKSVTNLWCPN